MTGLPSIDKPWQKYYPAQAIDSPLPKCKIFDYVYEKNRDNLDHNAINYYGRKYTYRQMFEIIEKTTSAFATLGIREGDILSICSFTTPETIFAFYAANRLGAIVNIIEPRTNSSLILERINQTNSKVLIIIDSFWGKISPVIKELTVLKIIVVGISDSMPMSKRLLYRWKSKNSVSCLSPKVIRWEHLIRSASCEPIIAPYRPGSPFAIIYTSGTTGIAKGAVFSDDCLTALEQACPVGNPRIYEGDTFLNIMPPFVAYGMFFGLFFVFCAKHENIIIPYCPPEHFVKVFLKYKPNHAVGVPMHWELLSREKKSAANALSHLLCAIAGGDKLDVQTEIKINQFFHSHGCMFDLQKGYGMTEMCSAATFTQCEENNELGSVGIPLCKNSVMIVDAGTDHELSYHKKGEICLSGPSMMIEYYQMPDETAQTIWTHKDGTKWIHTGDIGYINENGVLFIADRLKRIIVRPDGHNVWPSKIESVLNSHPAIKVSAVVGLKAENSTSGRIPTAFIVTEDGIKQDDSLIKEIEEFTKQYLPERDTATAYRFINSLPLTNVGKVDYLTLEKENR